MIHSYTCVGEYKGQIYKIVSVKICRNPGLGYGAVVEVNGVKRHARIGTQKNIFANIEDAIEAAKRFIDGLSSPTLVTS